jgi:hypothetical protein
MLDHVVARAKGHSVDFPRRDTAIHQRTAIRLNEQEEGFRRTAPVRELEWEDPLSLCNEKRI